MSSLELLKDIVQKSGLENAEDLIKQLEIFSKINTENSEPAFAKLAEIATTDPTIIEHFVEGFREAGKQIQDADLLNKQPEEIDTFLNDQAKELDM